MPAPILVPDTGPLITLAYAGQLELLQRPGWIVHVVDMVLHEATRNQTPTSEAIAAFVREQKIEVIPTSVWTRHRERLTQADAAGAAPPRRTGLGELAIQEYMNRVALDKPTVPAVFLFEDHRIARASFHLPENVSRASTRAFLLFLEESGWIESAADVERRAIQSGRNFSRLRFP